LRLRLTGRQRGDTNCNRGKATPDVMHLVLLVSRTDCIGVKHIDKDLYTMSL
jgi:hypothetical protein